MTFLLKNSLGGNSKTTFIANINLHNQYLLETLSTIYFASRAKMVKNEVKINEKVQSKSIQALKTELIKAKEELQ